MNLQMETRGRLELSPLIDIVLVLLLIFMLFPVSYKHPVTIPPADDCYMGPEQDFIPYCSLILRMDRAGRHFIDKEQISQEYWEVRVSQTLQGRGNKLVFIAASGDLPYGRAMDFFDRSRRAGAQNLAVVFDDLEDTAPFEMPQQL